MRDDFSERIKQILAARAGHRCSNPSCRAQTSGPQLDDNLSLSVGVAAHITAAAPGGPRFDPALSHAERADIENAIWLCQTCSRLIDGDDRHFSVKMLSEWRSNAEKLALAEVGKTTRHQPWQPNVSEAEAQIHHNLMLRDTFLKAFLKPIEEQRQLKKSHPFDKFRTRRVIIRSINDQAYPDIDESSTGISSWFRVELFDFYHRGLEVILSIKRILYNPDGRWKLIENEQLTELEGFNEAKAWVIGRIPYRYVRDYDLRGDEFYNIPHIYCAFEGPNGMPFEEIRHALVGETDNSDWPLKSVDRIP